MICGVVFFLFSRTIPSNARVYIRIINVKLRIILGDL